MYMCGPKATVGELGKAQHGVVLLPDLCHHLSAHIWKCDMSPHIMQCMLAIEMKSLQAAEWPDDLATIHFNC
jgi:hypothetical protein